MMKDFHHVGIELQDLKTENIEGKRFMSLLKALSTLVSPRYSLISPRIQLVNGEEGLEKQRPTRLVDRPHRVEPAYIISVSRISKIKSGY